MSSMLVLLCVSCFTLVTSLPNGATVYAPEDADYHFEQFIQKFGKTYANEKEKQMRFQIFKEHLVRINELNKKSDHAVFGITRFTDISHEELNKIHSCFKKPNNFLNTLCKSVTDNDINYNDAPDSFDWRDHNAVTGVKDQLRCGSCYAFSSIGNIEGQYAIKHNAQVTLSEQQIVDCDTNDDGCDGGYPSTVMRFGLVITASGYSTLIEQGGSESEDSYPYTGQQGTCQFDASNVAVHLTGCNSYNLNSQEKLKQLLYHNGPISIAIQAESLNYYTQGIIHDDVCNEGQLDHAVLLVGYGTENGKPYWIVKNSWGTRWGEAGYFRMQRGENNLSCGMMNELMASAVVA